MITPEEITDAQINLYKEYINSQSINYIMDMIEFHRRYNEINLNDLSENEKKVLKDLLLDIDETGKKDAGFEDIRSNPNDR